MFTYIFIKLFLWRYEREACVLDRGGSIIYSSSTYVLPVSKISHSKHVDSRMGWMRAGCVCCSVDSDASMCVYYILVFTHAHSYAHIYSHTRSLATCALGLFLYTICLSMFVRDARLILIFGVIKLANLNLMW